MANGTASEVEILIRTTGDPTGAVQISGALKDVQAQGVATAEAITGSWEKLSATTGQTVAQLQAIAAANAEAAASAGAAASGGGVSGASTQEAAIQREISAIVATRRALLEAQIAGQTETVAGLRTELGIRQQTLAALRSETLSQEGLTAVLADQNELLALASIRNKEVAASGLMAGANLNKAKGEALVLSREIATGSVNARTLGALLGSLGTTLTLAAIAALFVGEAIKSVVLYASHLTAEIDKATKKIAQQLPEWDLLAQKIKAAPQAFDLVEQVGRQMHGVDEKLDEMRSRQLSWWRETIDLFAVIGKTGFEALSGGQMPTQGPQMQALIEAQQKARVEQQLMLKTLSDIYNKTVQTAAVWESIKSEPFAQGLQDADKQIEAIKAQIADFGPIRSIQDLLNFTQLQKNLEDAQRLLELLRGAASSAANEATHLSQELQKVNQITLTPQEKIAALKKELASANDELHRMGFASAEAAIGIIALGASGGRTAEEMKAVEAAVRSIITLTGQLHQAENKEAKSVQTAAHKDFTAVLKEEEALLQRIRQQNQLIQQNPFLSADKKQSTTAANDRAELAALNVEMVKLQNYTKKTPLDPAEVQQASQKMQEMVFRAQQLRMQIQATSTFGGQMRTELQGWANSFGTTAHQIAATIEGTINAALQQFNQLILTGKFNAQALLQQIVQLGLTLVEQLAIQQAMSAINHAIAASQAAATGAAISTAMAAPATLVSIATEGEADVQAPIAIAGAIAAVQGLSFAHEGGVVGSLPPWRGGALAHDERLTVTKVGETILPTHISPVVIPKMHSGGVVDMTSGFSRSFSSGARSQAGRAAAGTGGGGVEIHVWADQAEAQKNYMNSSAGQKHLKKLILKNR